MAEKLPSVYIWPSLQSLKEYRNILDCLWILKLYPFTWKSLHNDGSSCKMPAKSLSIFLTYSHYCILNTLKSDYKFKPAF